MHNDQKQEREESMGFTLAEKVAKAVAEIALSMGESEEAVTIPDTQGQVLVRQGTKAFLDRKDVQEIFKIPVKLKIIVQGEEREELFFVCAH